ncbi:MAG: type II toxin-antitoxin system PemK/MazF family toxin [Verrucomicrobiota bacterium]|nr:type II toxin-antitoxin system PemK/MazF family toxin [Verrucomicrobiota bacterium]
MKRGNVVWVNLTDTFPPEMGKMRPGIIISNTDHNGILETVVIIPLSSRAPEIWPLRVRIAVSTKKPSFAIIPGLRQVSKARLHEVIGIASEETTESLFAAATAYLSD